MDGVGQTGRQAPEDRPALVAAVRQPFAERGAEPDPVPVDLPRQVRQVEAMRVPHQGSRLVDEPVAGA
jgi:hypothetical protein